MICVMKSFLRAMKSFPKLFLDRPRHALGWLGAVLALLWLLFRSGARPSRLAYPCQRAAFAASASALGPAVLAAAVGLVAARRGVFSILRTARGQAAACSLAAGGVGIAACAAVLAAVLALEPGQGAVLEKGQGGGAVLAPPADYHPEVFLVNDARGPEPGRHGGVDDLMALLGRTGLKLYRSARETQTSGPDGLIDRDDVVLIKVNAQWTQRGGTSTDVLRGVIRWVVEHPDGFLGEVLVADNGQGGGNLDPSESNAEDHGQSALDVVASFAAEGWRISAMLWDGQRRDLVEEFAAGDERNGYVVNPAADLETATRVSYPKFRTPLGTCVSYKHGVWSPGARTYDSGRLVVINVPVLKTHSIYGITASVKNHMGVVTRELGTGAHDAVGRGGLGSFLAEVRRPDLNILDSTWVLARPGSGPQATYEAASRRDQLAASRDPVALDAWAAKFILLPQVVENGYRPEDYRALLDPDDPGSVFRRYLDRSMNELLRAGVPSTNDPAAVTLHVWDGGGPPPVPFVRGDANRDGPVNISDPIFTLSSLFLGVGTIRCEDALDSTDDGRIDLSDAVHTLGYLFLGGPEPAAPFPEASADPTPDDLGCRE